MRTYVAEFFPPHSDVEGEPERKYEVQAEAPMGALRKALIKASGKPTAGYSVWVYPKVES